MTRRVVVVGGGIIGLTVAWRAAQSGADTTVVDPDPDRGASWVAAGMLAPVTEAHPGEAPLLAFNQHAARRWPSFVEELTAAAGAEVELRTHGTIVAALDDDDRRHVDDLAERLDSLGLQVERLRGRELRRRVPALAPGVRGGLDVAGDHAVDNRQVVAALRVAATRAGVGTARQAASAVQVDDDRVSGLALADGRTLPADVVVVAAGAWSGQLDLPAGVRAPIRPVRGEVLRLQDDATAPLLARTVRGRARGWPVYVVPRGHGEVVVGATADDRGFDVTVTGGGVLDLLRAATDLVPGVRELALVEARAGLRPGTPDNAPLVGPTAVDGLVMATGHFRHGILQAPVTGDAVAAWLGDGAVPEVLAVADPGRFPA